MRVVVVGSGILGASIAFHFAQRNIAVTLIHDSAQRAATNGSFGWINAFGVNDPDYFALRVQAVQAWHHWADTLPSLPVQLHGGLDWDLDVEATHAAYQNLGLKSELLTRKQIAQRFPNLGNLPEQALYNPDEGLADPDRIANALLQVCPIPPSELNARVTGFDTKAGQIVGVQTAERIIEADHVVLAVGLQTKALLDTLDVPLPMDNEMGVLFHTNPLSEQVKQVISTPNLHFWQKPDGRIIAGEDLGGKDVGANPDALKQRILKGLADFLPNAGSISLSEMRQTKRPMPKDGRPAVGHVTKGLSVACTHSGITLAPLIGQSIVDEVLDGTPLPQMVRYTPKRFS